MALEGTHRLEAAARPGIAPKLLILQQEDLVAADSLDCSPLQPGETYTAGDFASEVRTAVCGCYRLEAGYLTLVSKWLGHSDAT
jgi:hypothetical protein